jgi:RimJ/RimL family protein N-acetyltransferase
MLGPVLECGQIEGEALRLVPTLEHHLPNCIRWLNDPEVTRYLSAGFGINERDEQSWYSRASEHKTAIYWSIELGEVHVGQAGAEGLDWVCRTVETGTFIGEKAWWGKGIASAVMARRAAYLFEDLNLTALYTQIYMPNEGSLRAAQKTGYREYGRRPYSKYLHGEYLTSWLGVLSRDEWQKQRG